MRREKRRDRETKRQSCIHAHAHSPLEVQHENEKERDRGTRDKTHAHSPLEVQHEHVGRGVDVELLDGRQVLLAAAAVQRLLVLHLLALDELVQAVVDAVAVERRK